MRATLMSWTGRIRRHWPIVIVLLVWLVAMGTLATGHWRRGSFIVGASVLLAGVLRAVLPTRKAGLLAVRSRWFDASVLLFVAVAMLALTLVVPPSHPGQ